MNDVFTSSPVATGMPHRIWTHADKSSAKWQAPIIVHTAQWQHLASARFGPGRPCSVSPKVLWSGDCYRYDIFLHSEMKWLALRWWNGAGEGWLITTSHETRGEQSLLRHITTIENEATRWDYCHFLWEAVEQSRIAGQLTHEGPMRSAILEKRVRIRRKNGQQRVVIQPRIRDLPALIALGDSD